MRDTDFSSNIDSSMPGICQHNRELEAAGKVPRYVVRDVDGWIAIDRCCSKFPEYLKFDGASVSTMSELLHWIRFLCNEPWMSPRHVAQLIDVVGEWRGWPYGSPGLSI
jgi:hypothetical protein